MSGEGHDFSTKGLMLDQTAPFVMLTLRCLGRIDDTAVASERPDRLAIPPPSPMRFAVRSVG